jgi:autotransporter-associated beta strand protein
MKKITGLIAAALMLAAGVVNAQNTYIWDGETDGDWGKAANWNTASQTWSLNAIAEFNAAVTATTNTYLGAAARTARELKFNANADSNIGINLADSNGTTARNLSLNSFPGGAQTINVDSGAAADIRIFGPGSLALATGTGGSVADLIINHSGSGNLGIESKITSGSGYGIVKNGSGTLTLAPGGDNTYNNFTLNDGRVRIGGTSVSTALGTNTVYLNGGTLSSDSTTARSTAQALVFGGNVKLGQVTDTGALTLTGAADLGGATRTITADSAVTLGGVISNGGLTKEGTGTMTLTNANTYAGVTTVKAGALNIRNASALGTTAGNTVVQSGGTLQLQGSNMTISENINIAGVGAGGTSVGALRNVLTGGGSNTVSGLVTLDGDATIAGGHRLTLTGGVANNHVLAHSGGVTLVVDSAITGSGSILKDATADLTLKGLNTYTGDTTINAGNLFLADNAGLTFVIGANGVNNKLTGTGTVNLDGDFTFNLTTASTTVGDLWTISDVSSQTFGSTFTVVDFTDAGSDKWTKTIAGSMYYEFSEATGVLTVIPEPATISMLGLGAIITMWLRRMRTR